jgi:hypothetical protein
MAPGDTYGCPWLVEGPYRLYDTPQFINDSLPFSYADFLTVPGHPEFTGRFFNSLTEIRDIDGYEWYPNNEDIPGTAWRGIAELRRAMDSKVLATLFTHELYIQPFNASDWQTALSAITSGLSAYNPVYTTMDYACQYVRALHTSEILCSVMPDSHNLVTTLVGLTDLPTSFDLYTEANGQICSAPVGVSNFFLGNIVTCSLNPSQISPVLDHITITPNCANVNTGATCQFTAQGYDVLGDAIPNLAFTWSAGTAGSISTNGKFTAGSKTGAYCNAITASCDGVAGQTSVTVSSNCKCN